MSKRILFLPGSYTSPPARFRVWQFVKPLSDLGYDVKVRVPFPDRLMQYPSKYQSLFKKFPNRFHQIARLLSSLWMLRDVWRFDAVIANRDINPERWTSFLERIVVKAGSRLIFDFDDAIYLGGRDQKLQKILRWCYAVTPGNPTLEKYAKQYSNNVIMLPTVVDTDYYKPVQSRPEGKLRIGWSGSASTNKHCLPLVKHTVEKLSKEIDFDFIVISNEDPKIQWEGVHSTFIKWDAQSEVAQLQHLDIGLMPLQDNEFEKGKCGLKAIQYMGVGVPAVVSKVGVNADIIKHGESGFHCITEQDWMQTLKLLANDEELRKRIGQEGRRRVEAYYSIHFAIKKWEQILNTN